MTRLSLSRRHRSVNGPALLGLTGFGLFLASLDAYVVVAALLRMLTSVRVPVNHLERATPIITGFLLGYLAVMPLAGGLSDRLGRVRVFSLCLLLFAAGSIVTASASELPVLVAGRVAQGAGGGALVPVALALAADLYPAGQRGPILGALSALQEIGSVLGPLWGGIIAATGDEGWRWIFWANALFAGVLLLVLWRSAWVRPSAHSRSALDLPGALLAGCGLALLTVALYADDPVRSAVGAGFWWQALLALLCFILFAWREGTAAHPLVELRHFREPAFTGAALTNAIAGAGLMVGLVFIPVLAQSPIFSMDPRQAAFLLFRMMLGIPIGALAGGALAGRLHSYRTVAGLGMVLTALGFFWLSGWDQHALQPHLLGPLRTADVPLFLAGLGLGLEIAPVSAALLDVVGAEERGGAAALLVVMRLLGMLIGFSLLAGYGLHQFQQLTAHLAPPLITTQPGFAQRHAHYLEELRRAILNEYRAIFSATALLVLGGAVIAAATLGPAPRRPR